MKSLVERFQADQDLTNLREDEVFEAFAGFCVLSSYYGNDFRPDTFRMGGGNDLGVDVFGIDRTAARQLRCPGRRRAGAAP
jgi:hypothetical protein